MATAKVKPGSCKLDSTIIVNKAGKRRRDYTVSIEIDSQCPSIKKLAEELKVVDGFEESFKKISTSEIYRLSEGKIKHLSCPVPSAILKTIEVECGLNLPQEVEMVITKD